MNYQIQNQKPEPKEEIKWKVTENIIKQKVSMGLV